MSNTTINDVTCLGCGCACDDLIVSLDAGAVVHCERACTKGETWLRETPVDCALPVTIDGQPATLAAAIDRAAEVLSRARSPLVYGLTNFGCNAQRLAVAVADRLGATLDTPTSSLHGPTGMTFHGVGEVTCTLGEVRHRGDVILFWRADPATTHPRHFERYSLDAPGMFLPGGRADRSCIVVDTSFTATAEAADLFIPLRPGADFEALWILRALVQGATLDAELVEAATDVPLTSWQTLATRLRGARFSVMIHDEQLALMSGRQLNLEALQGLARDLSVYTRAVVNGLRGGGNHSGADNVVLWQTGYPFGVNFARGYPRYNPGEFTAGPALERGEFDAALLLGCDDLQYLPADALARLRDLPRISIGAGNNPWSDTATVRIALAPLGISAGGTIYRMDEVPLPLRPVRTSTLPTDVEVLRALAARLAGS